MYVYIYVYQRVAKRINLLWEQDVAGSNPVIPNIVLRLYGSKAVRFWQQDSVELQAFEAEQLCCEAGPERNPFLITDS